ncbi:MAG TPA: FlgD immunoglobulin-like domain containing protein [Candidatus Saccharimonadales bacterium]|nr:FlgD immunoglobulin-like domain containing protein [Candidatus Saccharimonadales bacterium]
MKKLRPLLSPLAFAGTLFIALFSAPQPVHANVYATDIKFNGSLQGVSTPQGASTSIRYLLNEPATLGVTVNILSGTNVVRTLAIAPGASGALRGANVVVWDGKDSSAHLVALGTYKVSITAATAGFTNWTQTSIDTNAGMTAFFPLGIDVDRNTNSPYYGRVVMGCAALGTNASQMIGLYKMNADGSQADEGWYGNAGYTNDDALDAQVAGQFANSGGYDPMKIRIGDDDRIYWVDNSSKGAVIAADILATTNQIVINESTTLNNPDAGDISASTDAGFQEFDVTGTTTTNAAVWLPDNDYPSWGIWMYHLTNGAVDPNDVYGTQVVETQTGDVALVTSGGCMVDNNLDVFVGQDRNNENAVYDAMVFTNWNMGVLPPDDSNGSTAFSFVMGSAPGQVEWGYGNAVNSTSATDPTFEGVRDVVINSRNNPTMVAVPMSKGSQNGNGGGIRVLNATNGFLISVTNGASVQTLTNIDWNQAYTCAAWDNVGNLYGASTTRNLWRAWSPPGTNQATTVAVATVHVVQPPTLPFLSSITDSGSTVTIHFTGSANDPASDFGLQGSTNVQGPYLPVSGAVVTGSAGVYSVSTATNGATQFYRISR